MDLRELILNGCLIYPKGNKFAFRKESVPNNNSIIEENVYDNYDLAIQAAMDFLQELEIIEWTVILRYNRGLGIEYKNFPNFKAKTREEAEVLAQNMVSKILVNSKIKVQEIRLRPKNIN